MTINYFKSEYHWPLQFNLIMVAFFIEKYSWVYQGIIYLRWMLHRINNLLLHAIFVLDYQLFYFQINDAC